MPIEVGLWRLGDSLQKVEFSSLDAESRLEQILAKDISIIDPDLLLIGRQVPTAYGKFIDLLALYSDANFVVIELKRNRTPRDVVAQLLDYGSWVRNLEDDDTAGIFEAYLQKYYPDHAQTSLDQAFCEKFSVPQMPDEINDSHRLVVVACELDDSTERIISYLSDGFGVGINAVFFRVFKDGANEYLTRAWLIDPGEVEATVVQTSEKVQWNGEYYVSFGGDRDRDWEEARKYGFISAGGGLWFSKSLSMLVKGARIWVNTPAKGYVGVGKVVDEVVPIDDFMVTDESGNQVPLVSLPVKAAQHTRLAQDPEKAEHVVRVKWIKTVPASEAIREKGFFGNQNSAAKPRVKKWLHTVERLKVRFGIPN
jgi:hypothetical protein